MYRSVTVSQSEADHTAIISISYRTEPEILPGQRIPRPTRARIFSPGMDSKEPIPPAYVAWRAGTITIWLLGS